MASIVPSVSGNTYTYTLTDELGNVMTITFVDGVGGGNTLSIVTTNAIVTDGMNALAQLVLQLATGTSIPA